MITGTNRNVAATFVLLLWMALTNVSPTLAQNQKSLLVAPEAAQADEINHDVQLYLLVGSNVPGEGGGIPKSINAVVKQLNAALPFSNYRLVTTFFNRVKDSGTIEVSGIGGFPLTSTVANPNTPSFFNFNLSSVKLITGANDPSLIRVTKFRFGLKVPVQTANFSNESGKTGYPVVQYQDTGISTETNVREAEATIVGTLAAS